MIVPVSPFLAFAERISKGLEHAQIESDGTIAVLFDLNEILLSAERHARLLAQIEQTVNEHIHFRTVAALQAHIKALLEQP